MCVCVCVCVCVCACVLVCLFVCSFVNVVFSVWDNVSGPQVKKVRVLEGRGENWFRAFEISVCFWSGETISGSQAKDFAGVGERERERERERDRFALAIAF